MQELQDGLLAAYLSQKYQSGDEAWNEDDLERFFKLHKSDLAWELPHYRGAVIHCKDRKTASASEILASSLKESYGAIVVGTTSYGRRL